jgi:hypothetical protein
MNDGLVDITNPSCTILGTTGKYCEGLFIAQHLEGILHHCQRERENKEINFMARVIAVGVAGSQMLLLTHLQYWRPVARRTFPDRTFDGMNTVAPVHQPRSEPLCTQACH